MGSGGHQVGHGRGSGLERKGVDDEHTNGKTHHDPGSARFLPHHEGVVELRANTLVTIPTLPTLVLDRGGVGLSNTMAIPTQNMYKMCHSHGGLSCLKGS